MKIALVAIAVLAMATLGFWWYSNRQYEAGLRIQAASEARTDYKAKSFPASVSFPRGGVIPVDYWGEMVWKGSKIEIASCSGDTLERLYAEFRTAPAAFADADHPLVRVHLGIVFSKPSIPGNEAFHIIREETHEGWRIRHTLVATPHGALVDPPEIDVSKWPVAPGYTRRLFEMRDPKLPPEHPQMSRFERRQIQERQAYRDGQEKLVNEERRKKHHHFAMVEAIKDFGEGRSVTVRRVGQYFDPSTYEQQSAEVKAMVGKVRVGS